MTDDVDAVVFDLDGTICEYRRSTADLLDIAHDEVGREGLIEERAYYEKFGEFAAEMDSMSELREECFVAIAEEDGWDPVIAREMARIYERERDHRNVRPLPGAMDVLERFAEEYPVGLVTNAGPDSQYPKLDALGIVDHFDALVYAGHDGVERKPSAHPFEVALRELGVEASRTVHVGNSVPSDVAGAHAAGLRSVWLAEDPDLDPDPEPHYRIESMRELLSPPWRVSG